MMMKKKVKSMKLKRCAYLIKFMLCLLSMPMIMHGSSQIGSDNSVTRIDQLVQLIDGVRVAGFVALQGGFSLTDNTVSAQFDSFFPVSGQININHGNLYLTRDLILADIMSFQEFGNIFGDGYNLQFAPSMSAIPTVDTSSFTATFSTLQVFLNSDITLQGATNILFTGVNVLNGQGNTFSLGTTSGTSTNIIQVGTGSTLTLRNIVLDNVNGTNIQCVDNTGIIIFEDAQLNLTNNFSFATGSLQVQNSLIITGSNNTFTYISPEVSTILDESKLIINGGVTLSYQATAANLLQFATSRAALMLMSGKLTANSLTLTGGGLGIGGHSYLAGTISLGGGTQNLNIEILPAAVLELLSGASVTY
jgi:hypothetical protein